MPVRLASCLARILPLAATLAIGLAQAGAASEANLQPVDVPAVWAAVAPATVEPRVGFVHLSAGVQAPIRAILVRPGQTVAAGELLAEQENAAEQARVQAAEAEAAFRQAERDNSVTAGGSANRRAAEDANADAAAAAETAQANLDAVRQAHRDGNATAEAVAAAEAAAVARQADRDAAQRALAMEAMMASVAAPTRTESALAVARAELAAARAELERTRIRAPSNGTVIEIRKSPGEMADPSPEDAVAVIGDLTGLRLRAEVDERSFYALHKGQLVVARTPAFDGEIRGRVTQIANSARPKRLLARRPGEPSNENVVEVLVEIDESAGLLPGMRVDAFFCPSKWRDRKRRDQ